MNQDSSAYRAVVLRGAIPFLLVLALALVGAGAPACTPDIPSPSGPVRHAPADDESGVLVVLEPPSPVDEAPPVLRARLQFDSAVFIDPAEVFVVRGEVGAAQLRQLEKGVLSQAFVERLVPALAWRDEASVVVAPTVTLDPGATYAIAAGNPPFATHVRVIEEDDTPTLQRIWPPVDGGATARFGVWCADDVLGPLDLEMHLDLGGPEGVFRRGIVDGAGTRCARFEAASAGEVSGGDAFVAPPAVRSSAGLLRLDPRPFTSDDEPPIVESVACDTGEIPFGPACVQVLDDRLLGHSPEAALLWVVASPEIGLDQVFITSAGDPFVVAPLPPLSSIVLDVSTVQAQGQISRLPVQVNTLAPMPHVILNEVLANPLGAEPDQEWVEIVNDGLVPADLTGYVLADVGGEAVLPGGVLAPGGYALITDESFAEDNELDTVPAEGTPIVRVPKLGKGGLSNSGEPLKLLDSSGSIVSRFPPLPKPKAGLSVARASPSAQDGLASSFAITAPTPGSENYPKLYSGQNTESAGGGRARASHPWQIALEIKKACASWRSRHTALDFNR